MHISLYVNDVVKSGRYDWIKNQYEPGEVTPFWYWYKKHTYYVIFSVGQEKLEEQFKKAYKDVIIFESERARNMNYPEEGQRNKLYISRFNLHFVPD